MEAATKTFTAILSPSEAPVTTQPLFIEKLLAPESAFMRVVEPYFARIDEMVRLTWEDLKTSWARLALENGTTEKIFAISLGYMVNAIILALYLNVLTVGSMKSAGRAVRSAVRQQLLVVKVSNRVLLIRLTSTHFRMTRSLPSLSLSLSFSLWDAASCWIFALFRCSRKAACVLGSPSSLMLL